MIALEDANIRLLDLVNVCSPILKVIVLRVVAVLLSSLFSVSVTTLDFLLFPKLILILVLLHLFADLGLVRVASILATTLL